MIAMKKAPNLPLFASALALLGATALHAEEATTTDTSAETTLPFKTASQPQPLFDSAGLLRLPWVQTDDATYSADLTADPATGLFQLTHVEPLADNAESYSDPGFDATLAAQLEAFVGRLVSYYQRPGAIAQVTVDGKTWYGVAGTSRVDSNRPMHHPDRFRVGSISKTFVATTILELVGEGRLSLDNDHLSQWLPEVPNAAQITIRQLLAHTSGIYDYVQCTSIQNGMQTDPLEMYTRQQLLDLATGMPAYNEPGAGYHYSNTNYLILGMIIEQVTGKSLPEALHQYLLAPLRMAHTGMPEDPSIAGAYAHGYVDYNGNHVFDPTDDTTFIDPSIAWASGTVVSNMYDLTNWGRHFAEGDMLTPEVLAQRVQDLNQMYSGYPVYYGLGIIKINDFLGHGGLMQGYQTYIFYDPVRHVGINLSMNRYPLENTSSVSCPGGESSTTSLTIDSSDPATEDGMLLWFALDQLVENYLSPSSESTATNTRGADDERSTMARIAGFRTPDGRNFMDLLTSRPPKRP
ncbi:serine hydrolase domain-containing protein [Endothiovibrio diazotrophicus]